MISAISKYKADSVTCVSIITSCLFAALSEETFHQTEGKCDGTFIWGRRWPEVSGRVCCQLEEKPAKQAN